MAGQFIELKDRNGRSMHVGDTVIVHGPDVTVDFIGQVVCRSFSQMSDVGDETNLSSDSLRNYYCSTRGAANDFVTIRDQNDDLWNIQSSILERVKLDGEPL
jgi:hypothetical protein